MPNLIIILISIFLGFLTLYFLLRQLISKQQSEKQLEDIINKVFGMSANKIADQSRQILIAEKDSIKTDLANKQSVFENLVKQLQEDLAKSQTEIRNVEQDRTKKFAQLTESLEQHRELTKELKVSTQQLASVLANNQTRGEWGERIIEDLLISNGLKEGVHYLKQGKQLSSGLKPDITLLLPDNRNVPVDVKFPYQEIQKMTLADSKSVKAEHLKQFSQDVKVKINKVSEYISAEQNTLDYAILFVPNEMIFSFINQRLPDLVDLAISKRVLIVSPFTFLIVARTVMESYRNFMIGDKLKEVVKHIDEFAQEWVKFKESFEKFGRSLGTLQTDYEKMTNTRAKQMDKKISKIDDIRKGTQLLEA